MIDKQMRGDPTLNWNPAQGEVKAPLILWGPCFWCDGLKPRSDGLIWTCCEPTSDVYNNPHPIPAAVPFVVCPQGHGKGIR